MTPVTIERRKNPGDAWNTVAVAAGGSGSLAFKWQEQANVTLLVSPNATIIGDVSPGVTIAAGIMFFSARIRNSNPSPHDLHFQGFVSAGMMDVTVQPGEDDTVSGVFMPTNIDTYQIWATDDNAADPGEVGCLVVVCQTACYYPLP